MSFYGGVLGGLLRLECEKCGEIQVRARPHRTEKVFCRKCGAPLPLGPEPRAARSAPGKRKR
jgi:ribosomal protein S27E